MNRHRPLAVLGVSILLSAGGLLAIFVVRAAMPIQLADAAPLRSPPAAGPEPSLLGAPACPWPSASGHRLLDRQLGNLSFSNVTVLDIVEALAFQHGVPLSFIEAAPGARFTFNLPRCTVRQLLDQVVATAPGYRYGFVGPHLVLYSTDPKWQTRIGDLKLAPNTRLELAKQLVKLLRRQVPSLIRLSTALFGNIDAFIYKDQAAVAGPGSIIELFTQLLGGRASAIFMVYTTGVASRESLTLDAAQLVKSLEVTASSTILRQRGETVQLQVIGLLPDGTRQDLTAARCETRYVSGDDKVLAVDSDGQVTALASGQTSIFVISDKMAHPISFKVTLPKAPRHTPAP